MSFGSAARFHALLVDLAGSGLLEDGRFPARNFLLEHALPNGRVSSYVHGDDLEVSTGTPRERLNEWNGHHSEYVQIHVRAGSRAAGFDVSDPDTPETFRDRNALDAYGDVDDAVDLVRVERLDEIARRSGCDVADLKRAAMAVGDARRAGMTASAEVRELLEEILLLWQENGALDNRPVFSGFWDAVADRLQETEPGWADVVRDRFGLAHHDPEGRGMRDGIEIIAFRYPASRIPRTRRDGPRFIARPTVLDGNLSTAFCTAPNGSGHGCCVDLSARGDVPCDEIVHPVIRLTGELVWAVGRISRPVPKTLRDARSMHLMALVERADDAFVRRVGATDGDLT
jgi:hypothetical protein